MTDAALPEPPAPPQRRPRASRQRGLGRTEIVDAAVRVLDADGLDAVTFRRVAHELGVGAASLYAYVDSKDVLVELILDRVMGEIDLSDLPDERPWQEQTKELIRRARTTFAAHGDIARATLGRIPAGANALAVIEVTLGILERSGLSDQVVAYAADLIGLVVGAASYEDSLHAQSGIGFEEFMRYIAEFRRYLESLPPERFPRIVELAGPLTRISPDEDERFEFMLDVIVDGLAAQH
ncbi:MAG TPA: TetR/AcrR family transcriptional regulator [Gaiellaceae bacterium]|jgi:AcrR family transcriptional regulator|nr:TetR/AcrR family transcriptional regulator [Gaiellaceae bacterium]